MTDRLRQPQRGLADVARRDQARQERAAEYPTDQPLPRRRQRAGEQLASIPFAEIGVSTSGRELLGMKVFARTKVLVLSFEDDRAELHRRLLAICQHHGINPDELKGWLFCRDLNGGAKLAELDAKGRRRQIGALDGMLRRAIARTGCSLVVLDPFVKIHTLNENDNPDMDFVCSALIKIAQDCGGGFAGAHP